MPFITPDMELFSGDAAFEHGDVTGRMPAKVQKLQWAATRGVMSWIVNGRDSVAVGDALDGLSCGTVVCPE